MEDSYWVVVAGLAQVFLTLGLVFYLGSIRLPLIMRGKVRVGDIALSREPWPEQEKKVANAFDNQFQLPVIFYFVVLVALTAKVGGPLVWFAWGFVVSRYVHAWLFITANNVVHRFWAYFVGLVFLTLMVLTLAFYVLVVYLAFGPH